MRMQSLRLQDVPDTLFQNFSRKEYVMIENSQHVRDKARELLCQGKCPFLEDPQDGVSAAIVIGEIASECTTFEQLLRLSTVHQDTQGQSNASFLQVALGEFESPAIRKTFLEEYLQMRVDGTAEEYLFDHSHVLEVFRNIEGMFSNEA